MCQSKCEYHAFLINPPHEFYETCHSVTFYFRKKTQLISDISRKFILPKWLIGTVTRPKHFRQNALPANIRIFFFHENKCYGMTGFTELLIYRNMSQWQAHTIEVKGLPCSLCWKIEYTTMALESMFPWLLKNSSHFSTFFPLIPQLFTNISECSDR